MRTPVSAETAERRVVHKFNKLFVPLMEIYQALQDLDPFETVVDAVLTRSEVGAIQVQYTTKPLTLTIRDGQKAMTLMVERVRVTKEGMQMKKQRKPVVI